MPAPRKSRDQQARITILERGFASLQTVIKSLTSWPFKLKAIEAERGDYASIGLCLCCISREKLPQDDIPVS